MPELMPVREALPFAESNTLGKHAQNRIQAEPCTTPASSVETVEFSKLGKFTKRQFLVK